MMSAKCLVCWFLVSVWFSVEISAKNDGNCFIEGLEQTVWEYGFANDKINDTTRDSVRVFKVQHIKSVENINDQYLTAKLTDTELIVSTSPLFEKYEEKETASTTKINIELTCDEDKAKLEFRQPIEDINNHKPTFEQKEYIFHLPMPWPVLDITMLTSVMVRDIDFKNRLVDFTIEPNDYLDISYNKEKVDPLKKNHYATIIPRKVLRFDKSQSFKIYATDQKDVFGQQWTEEATITITVDEETSVPIDPRFENVLYQGKYTKDDEIELDNLVITEDSFSKKIKAKIIDGEYKDNFELVQTSNKLTLKKLKDLDSELWNDLAYIDLTIEARNPDALNPGLAVVVLRLPTLEPPTTIAPTTTQCPICPTTTACPEITTIVTTECPTVTTDSCPVCPTTLPPSTTVSTTEVTTACPTLTTDACPECPTTCEPTTTDPTHTVTTECPACPTTSETDSTPTVTTNCPTVITECPTVTTDSCPECPSTCEPTTTDPSHTVTTECPICPTTSETDSTPTVTTNYPTVTTECPTVTTNSCPECPSTCEPTTTDPSHTVTTECPICPTTSETDSTPTVTTNYPTVTTECPTVTTNSCPECPSTCEPTTTDPSHTVTTECPICPTTSETDSTPTVTTNYPTVTTECPTVTTDSCPECPNTCEPTTTDPTHTVTTECPTVTTDTCPVCPTTCEPTTTDPAHTVTTECPTVTTDTCPICPTTCEPTTTDPSYTVTTECPVCRTKPQPSSTSSVTTNCPTAITECPTVTTDSCPECPTTCEPTTTDPTHTVTTECPTVTTDTCPVCPTTCEPTTTDPSHTVTTECPIVTTDTCPICPTTCEPTTTDPSHTVTTECPTVTTDTCPICPTTCEPTTTDPSHTVTTECPTVTTDTCPVCPTTSENPDLTTTTTAPPPPEDPLHFNVRSPLIFEKEPNFKGKLVTNTAEGKPVEAIKYSLNASADVPTSIMVEEETGTVMVQGSLPPGTYFFDVVATTATQTASYTIHLSVGAIEFCPEGQMSYALITKNVTEGEYFYNLLTLTADDIDKECEFSIDYTDPHEDSWFQVNETTKNVDACPISREDPRIVDMFVSQVQVAVSMECAKEDKTFQVSNAVRRRKRSDEEGTTISPRNWIKTSDIAQNPKRVIINVIVNDVNNNAPVFVESSPTYVGYPKADVADMIGPMSVYQVHATDKDTGYNAMINYTIVQNEYFVIHPETGVIYPTKESAELLTNSKDITLTILARDKLGTGFTSAPLELKLILLSLDKISVLKLDGAIVEDLDGILKDLQEASEWDIRVLTAAVLPDINSTQRLTKSAYSDEIQPQLSIVTYALDKNSRPISAETFSNQMEKLHIPGKKWKIDSSVPHPDRNEVVEIPADNDNTGLIVAVIILAVLLGVVIIGIGVGYFIIRRKRTHSQVNLLANIPTPPSLDKDMSLPDEDEMEKRRTQMSISLNDYLTESSDVDVSVPEVVPERRKSFVTFNDNVEQIEIEKI